MTALPARPEVSEPPYLEAGPEPRLVQLPPTLYLAIEGEGPPGTADFKQKIEALFEVAMAAEKVFVPTRDTFHIRALETQWWAAGNVPMEQAPRDEWRWMHLVRVPDSVTDEAIDKARKALHRQAKPSRHVTDVHLERLLEATCVQALHVGRYDDVGTTYAKLFAFIGQQGLVPSGRMHELYLNGPDEAKSEELQTVCRIPVRRR